MQSILLHLRRVFILLLNLLLSRRPLLRFVGWINRRRQFIASVFVAYPATEDYARAYVYPRHRHWMRWTPWFVGLLRQNDRWAVMFVISSTEADFSDADNLRNLRDLVTRTNELRQLLGVPRMTFAGILPGVLFSRRIIRETPEADTTVEAVIRAEQYVRVRENCDATVPLIVLGGNGFIGRRLVRRLIGRQVYCVDNAAVSRKPWPHHLRGKRAILINVSRRAALSDYLSLIWPGLVILNEVYPEPSAAEITRLSTIGSPLYHIAGVAGRSYPPFPGVYGAAIPCCAARNTARMKAVVQRLN